MRLRYLRISVTGRCNLRCRYCAGAVPRQLRSSPPEMPAEHH
jgi:molybdenum cofactor biosynthesis enzyme MoaA